MRLSLRQLERCEAVMGELQAEEEVRSAMVADWPHLDREGRAAFLEARQTDALTSTPDAIERGPELDAFIGATR